MTLITIREDKTEQYEKKYPEKLFHPNKLDTKG